MYICIICMHAVTLHIHVLSNGYGVLCVCTSFHFLLLSKDTNLTVARSNEYQQWVIKTIPHWNVCYGHCIYLFLLIIYYTKVL